MNGLLNFSNATDAEREKKFYLFKISAVLMVVIFKFVGWKVYFRDDVCWRVFIESFYVLSLGGISLIITLTLLIFAAKLYGIELQTFAFEIRNDIYM